MNSPNKYFSGIRLRRIELNVHLGVSEEERSKKQPVLIDLLFRFTQPPKAHHSDNINDTYCYDTLLQQMIRETESREFCLIEHMATHIYHVVKKYIADDSSRLLVSVTKDPKQYIPQLTGGAECVFGDEGI